MQLERGEVLALAIAFIAVALAVAIGLAPQTRAPAPTIHLAAAPADWPPYDVMLLVELPDSGGYLANDNPLNPDTLPVLLGRYVQYHPKMPRGFFLRVGPHRPEADQAPIVALAKQAGWRVFDADKSGVPIFHPFPVKPPPR